MPQGAPVFTPGTQLPEIFESLAPREGEKIVTKNYPSSFAKTELDGYLKGLGKNKIVLCGYMVGYTLVCPPHPLSFWILMVVVGRLMCVFRQQRELGPNWAMM